MPDKIDIAKKSFVKNSTAVLDFARIPPQAIDAEKNVIGTVLCDDKYVDQALSILRPECFYLDAHARIWKAIVSVHKSGDPIDVITVVENLKKSKDLESVGGAFYLARLSSLSHNWDNIKTHCLIVLEKYIARMLITIGAEMVMKGYDDSSDILEALEKSTVQIESIYDFFKTKSSDSKSAAGKAVDSIMKRYRGEEASQIITGWTKFDEVVCLDKPRLLVVASAQKVGKTAFVMAMIKNIILYNAKVAIKVYSFEMDTEAMIRRLISVDTSLTDAQLLSRGYKLTNDDIEAIEASRASISAYPMEITDKKMKIDEIRKNFKRFIKKNPGVTPIAVIDNHGFVVDKFEEEEAAAKGYAALRDETGGIIIVIHHLTTKNNKEFNIDNGYEPNKEMVRGNTRLLDFCNTLLLLHRPNYHLDLMRKLKLELSAKEYKAISKLFLVYCVLNRDGDTDLIRLEHEIKYSRFDNFQPIK